MEKIIKNIALAAALSGLGLLFGAPRAPAVARLRSKPPRWLSGWVNASRASLPVRQAGAIVPQGTKADMLRRVPILRSAATEDGPPETGEISPVHRHAWGENVGWVDFRPEGAALRIGGNILSGWIRIDNLGWVHLGDGEPADGFRYSNASAFDYGVNNRDGDLSGWAWSENAGWINFDSAGIYRDGRFSGHLWSANVGRIEFGPGEAAGYTVRTDPYPWKEIGTGAAIRAGGCPFLPGGGESIGVASGDREFTVPAPSGALNFCLGGTGGLIVEEPVSRFENSEGKIDPRTAGLIKPARGPPEREKNRLQTSSTADSAGFSGPPVSVFFKNISARL